MSIITLNPPNFTGRYLCIQKRNYAIRDVFHPKKGFLCRLISMPHGFLVEQTSDACSHLLGTHHQTPDSLEREFLHHD